MPNEIYNRVIATATEPVILTAEQLGVDEDIAFTWDIYLGEEGRNTFQLRIHDQEGTKLYTRNVYFSSLLEHAYIPGLTSNLDPSISAVLGYNIRADQVLPEAAMIRFMVRTYLASNTSMCEICEFPVGMCNDEHIDCAACGEDQPQAFAYAEDIIIDSRAFTEAYYLCHDCSQAGAALSDVMDLYACDDCETQSLLSASWVSVTPMVSGSERTLCYDCRDGYYWCETCERYGTDYDEWYEEGCADCVQNDSLIRAWDFRPELVFHPTIPVNPLRPLYIGMELEVSWDSSGTREWLQKLWDEHEDLLYVKKDSSVSYGFEVVTHPMSPDWAAENFPFSFFQEAIDAGAYAKHESCGTHIHIDKAALTTAQMWKLLQLHQRLKRLCGQVGGRGTQVEYATFDTGRNKPIKDNMLKIARDKGEAFGRADRYVAVNLQNEQTMELRYMEGSIHPHDIKKNIQWVQAIYDFTDRISVADVKNGVLDDPSYLLGFIFEKGNYPELAKHLEGYHTIPKTLERSIVCA